MTYGEFTFIERLLKPLAAEMPGALELGDDAALLTPPAGRELVIAKDALVAGVHFFADDPAVLVAGKALRVNLSDLAAMGAEPLGYLLAIALPGSIEDAWLEDFVRGLEQTQTRFGLGLLGGDTVSTPGPLTLSVTIIGHVPEGRALLRRGARPGDDVWVSGRLGEAGMGLRILRGLAVPEEEAMPLVARYHTPEPRLELGRALRGLAHAAIDISDGLVADLGHLCRRSGAGAVVELERLPVSDLVRGIPRWRETVLTGGDDYELLFTAAPADRPAIENLSRELGLPLTVIGRITTGEGVRVVDAEGRELPLDSPGWRHF